MQFIVLISALLASLTGLVAGERQPVRAQVEQSAQAMAAQAETAVTRVAAPVHATTPERVAQPLTGAQAAFPALISTVDTFLSLKQSWLE